MNEKEEIAVDLPIVVTITDAELILLPTVLQGILKDRPDSDEPSSPFQSYI